MNSPAAALVTDIYNKNRTAILTAAALTLAGCLLNLVLPYQASGSDEANFVVSILQWHLVGASFLLTFAAGAYTEFSSQKGISGFPSRQFTLPVSTLKLVTVPLMISVAGIEVVYWVWMKLVFSASQQTVLFAAFFGAYMVIYETVLWTLGRLGPARLGFLAFVGFILYVKAVLNIRLGSNVSEERMIAQLIVLAGITFVVAWICIARQRSGGGGRDWLRDAAAQFSGRLPGRTRGFRTATGAQFWFEWRRSGRVLPILVGLLIVFVMAPLSWWYPRMSLWTLGVTLFATPALALPVGKAFSKADYWSTDLSLPAVVAVRPLTSADLIMTKLKVATVSVGLSWFLILTFVSLWISLWGENLQLPHIRPHLAALSLVAAMLVTWRFMVGSLWLGLSGNTKIFTMTIIPYAAIPLFVVPALVITSMRRRQSLTGWFLNNLDWIVPALTWMAAIALIVKVVLSIYAWREVPFRQLRPYIMFWIAGTSCLLWLAISLQTGLSNRLPILIALLLIPVVRPGVAVKSLARNRHR
jgi:hypothetical protein